MSSRRCSEEAAGVGAGVSEACAPRAQLQPAPHTCTRSEGVRLSTCSSHPPCCMAAGGRTLRCGSIMHMHMHMCQAPTRHGRPSRWATVAQWAQAQSATPGPSTSHPPRLLPACLPAWVRRSWASGAGRWFSLPARPAPIKPRQASFRWGRCGARTHTGTPQGELFNSHFTCLAGGLATCALQGGLPRPASPVGTATPAPAATLSVGTHPSQEGRRLCRPLNNSARGRLELALLERFRGRASGVRDSQVQFV